MLVAVKNESRAWLYWTLSIITAAVHIFTMEYFWGLEFVRPLLLWIYYTNRADPLRNRIRKTLFRSLPYLGLLVAAVLLRQYFFQTFFVENPDPNTLRLIDQFKSAPIDAFIYFIVMVLRDLIFISVTTWEKTLHPGLIDLQTNSIVLSWALFLVAFLVLWFYRNYVEANNDGQLEGKFSSWSNQALMLGGAIFFLGTFPVWMTNKQITVGMYSDRFALPAMWGISILLVSLPSKIGISIKSRSLLLSILIGLSIGSHFRISNDFRWEWIRQKRFYWQLYWRAPEVEPGTAFFADGTVFTYVADYPLAFALNTLYDSAGQGAQLPYWFFELDSGFYWYPQDYLKGQEITGSLRNYSFQSDSLDSLLMDYNHRSGNCLWILDEQDSLINELTDLTREALPISHLGRIGMDGEIESYPPVSIFGSEPKHDWCYFFQMADAAHQVNNLEKIIEMERTVHQRGLEPNNKLEWLPFIDTYAANGYWEEASQITLEKFEVSPITRNTFCAYWESYFEHSDEASKDRETITNVLETLECR
jgi:hypothetical protein